MVDRASRDCVLGVVDDYLGGRIKSFEFDERLQNESSKTGDQTIRTVVLNLWFTYDDIIDHPVNLSKEGWDYVQRLRLLLSSDAEIERVSHWTMRQPLAFAGLVVLTALAIHNGFDSTWWLADVLIGTVAVISLYRRNWHMNARELRRQRISPFGSFGELRIVRKQAAAFQKNRYPVGTGIKRLRGKGTTAIMTSWSFILMIAFAPVVLLLSLLPTRGGQRVIIPWRSVGF